jgi:DNA-binding NarL/FixJ family response regulator
MFGHVPTAPGAAAWWNRDMNGERDRAIRVLIIDDHDGVRTRVRDALLAAFPDVTVEQADSGAAAVARVGAAEPALVILDLQLPGENGFQVLRALRQGRPDLPIVVLSALPAVPYAAAAARCGAVGYVCKSRLPDELLTVVERTLQDVMVRAPDRQARPAPRR